METFRPVTLIDFELRMDLRLCKSRKVINIKKTSRELPEVPNQSQVFCNDDFSLDEKVIFHMCCNSTLKRRVGYFMKSVQWRERKRKKEKKGLSIRVYNLGEEVVCIGH